MFVVLATIFRRRTLHLSLDNADELRTNGSEAAGAEVGCKGLFDVKEELLLGSAR
jgi:hypothetical protein